MGRSTHLQPPTSSSGGSRHQFLDVHLANTAAGYSSSLTTTLLQPPQQSLRSVPRAEESTRVQLQKQRLQDQQNAALVSKSIPGLKTSAAFFASLRTNLRLHASPPPPSPQSTPPSMRSSWTSLPPPSPLSGPVTPADSVMDPIDPVATPHGAVPPSPAVNDPLAGVPELHTYLAHAEDDKIDGLRLVADSVAQMRQTANQTLIFHPLNLAVVVGILAVIARFMHERGYDNMLVATTCSGVLMSSLLVYRLLTQDYLLAAEEITWAWLDDGDVIVTKFGDEIIGAVIVDWLSGESSKQRKKKAWHGEIKGWAVRLRYRRKGVGTALLEEVIKEGKRKGAENIDFADDHANSKRVLPNLYNGVFDKKEKKGRELLQDLWQSGPRGKRK